MKTLSQQRNLVIADMKTIVDTANEENRNLTATENTKFWELDEDVKAIDLKMASEAKSRAQRQNLAGLGPDESAPGSKHGGSYGTAEKGYLSPKSKGFAEKIAAGFHPDGQKALAPSGTVVTQVPMVEQSPVELGRAATGLWDLIPTVLQSEPFYGYLRQSVRTNNASMVAAGGLKPTSIYTIEKIDARLKVIAHLSEPIDRFILEDNSSLTTFVSGEMLQGLYDALAVQVLTGDGLGENLKGISLTSGIQTQSAGVDNLATLRSALTKLENVGLGARGFAVNAADWEEIESTRNTSGNFDVGGPVDAATRKAWGAPVAVVPGVPAGTAYLLGEGAVVLRQDSAGVRADWGMPGDSFERNQLVARTETRVNLDVLKPFGIVKITLPA